MKKYLSRKCLVLFQAVLIFIWLVDLSPLAGTDTYYSVFLLCGLAGLAGLLDNWRHPIQRPVALHLFAGVFALLVVMGNYELYQPFYALQSKLNLLMDLAGGFCIGEEVLTAMLRQLPLKSCAEERKHPKRLFFLTFAAIAVIDIGYLFAARYPGVLTTDSYSTIAQILNGGYNNTMPFWHTMLVQVFLKLGLTLFGEINRAVAFYHVFQLLFVAATLAYALLTLYQIGVPRLFLCGVFFVYGLLPYNIVYSVTLWKDIPFGVSALLMAVAFYRILKGFARRGGMDWVSFAIGALGVCLLRTNGWFAMLAALAVLALILRRDGKTLLIVLTAVLAVSWVLINPVLWLLNVPSTDLTEAFAVPMQQIARVVSNERELRPDEEALLSEIFDLEKMKELYNPQTVDPVKFETFRYGQKDFFRSHRWEFLKLYLSLGARYPVDYWEAWVEETRGYWNGGYFFWIYPARSSESPVMGIVHTGGDNLISSCYAAWFRAAEKPIAMQPLYSIGLRVWILIACCLINALKKNKQWLIAVPALVLLVGLWLGTPVYSEFRYAYPMILTSPFILMTTLYSPEKLTRL